MPIAIYTHIGDVLMESRINWAVAVEYGMHRLSEHILNKLPRLKSRIAARKRLENTGIKGP
jgi:hypothetical protein